MRTATVLLTGMLIGAAIASGFAQGGRVVGVNHVAISVADYEAATAFYRQQMGFREVFAFREANGAPYLTYFQVNANTFVEVMQATPQRPAGCPHFGLEVERLDQVVEQLKQRGVQLRAPSISPRTGSRIAVASGPGGINIELLEFGPESLHRKAIDSWK